MTPSLEGLLVPIVKVKGLQSPLQFPDEMNNESILEVLRQKFSRFAEPALTVSSGIIAEPVAGLAGIVQSVNPFADEGAGARAIEATKEALTIQPFTEEGREGLQDLGESISETPLIRDILETHEKAQTVVGDKLNKNFGPTAGALGQGFIGVLPDLLGLKAFKAAKNISKADLGTASSLGAKSRKIEDKIARAKELGFDTDLELFHGTSGKVKAFDLGLGGKTSGSDVGKLGVSVALNKKLAQEYAEIAAKNTGLPPVVLSLVHRAKKVASIELDGAETNLEMAATVKAAWDDGFDGLMIKNYTTPSGIKNQKFIIVKDPNQLRLKNAKFNIKEKFNPNLLASVGAGFLVFNTQEEQSAQ